MKLRSAAGTAVLTLGAVMAMAGCANGPGAPYSPAEGRPSSQSQASGGPSSSDQVSGAPHGDTVSCSYIAGGERSKPVDPPPMTNVSAKGKLSITLDMTAGPVALTLDREKAPCTVNSFEALAKQGYFDDTSCHRLVDQGIFVLQCGDPSGTGRGGPGYRFADELTGHEKYTKGVLAMANSGPDTNGSQFFIVWADSPLDPNYTIFGTVDESSMDVITTIASRGVSQQNSPNPNAEAKITRAIFG